MLLEKEVTTPSLSSWLVDVPSLRENLKTGRCSFALSEQALALPNLAVQQRILDPHRFSLLHHRPNTVTSDHHRRGTSRYKLPSLRVQVCQVCAETNANPPVNAMRCTAA